MTVFPLTEVEEWKIESTDRGFRERRALECSVGVLLGRGSTHWSPKARKKKVTFGFSVWGKLGGILPKLYISGLLHFCVELDS